MPKNASLAIVVASTPLFSAPDSANSRETDCLFGERVAIHEELGEWCDVTLKTDGYRGWLFASSLGELPEPSHRVVSTRALLTRGEDIKTQAINDPPWLPMGSLVTAVTDTDSGAMVIRGEDRPLGYTRPQHLLPVGDAAKDWVEVAERQVGTPYRWGGRDSIGIDCSALVQLALAAGGRSVPRNSGDQERKIGKTIKGDALKRGDLVFWKGHVGIMVDAETLLHANMHHAMTATEPLAGAVKRLEGQGLPVTRYARP